MKGSVALIYQSSNLTVGSEFFLPSCRAFQQHLVVKHLFHLALLLLTFFFWKGFADSGTEIEVLQQHLEKVEGMGDPKDETDDIEQDINAAQGQRIFMGLMLTVGSCAVVGIFVWSYMLPLIAQRATHAIYDSGELLEKDAMREAHSLLAQGEYEEAFKAFRKVANEDPSNRLPWVEMSNVQRQKLFDPDAAAALLREALETHEWEDDDAAFLLFRMAEIYEEDLKDRTTACAIMQQVVDTFPQSRHSANAAHKLRDWNRENEEKALMDQLHGKGSGGNPPA